MKTPVAYDAIEKTVTISLEEYVELKSLNNKMMEILLLMFSHPTDEDKLSVSLMEFKQMMELSIFNTDSTSLQ